MRSHINHKWSVKLVKDYSYCRYTKIEISRAIIRYINNMVRLMILKIDLGKYKLELGNGRSKSGAITGRWRIKNNKIVVQQKKVVNHIEIIQSKWFLIQKDSRIMNRK